MTLSKNRDRICPWSLNSRFWQFKGKPVLLLGGSCEDNLFQIPSLEEHLDLLVSSGGNYVRNTMSARDPGNVQPHRLCDDGLYDLEQWSEEYWERFDRFLKLTSEREIIAQFEIWDRFDFACDPWQYNSFNPKLNKNYTTEESKLAENLHKHSCENESRWFFSIPEHDNNELLLKYQKAYVDKVLSYSLNYPNVLYCMDNETSGVAEWGSYWSEYIKTKTFEKDAVVQTTEMWDSWYLTDDTHAYTWKHPETYSFCDVSQNNHQKGQDHWDNLQAFQKYINPIRPVNTVKTYGADGAIHGDSTDGKERFWRSIFGGCASARFHRPPAGLGLSEEAQFRIKSLRMVVESINWFEGEPHNELFSERSANGAYCYANIGKEYAIYFPNGEPVTIDLSHSPGKLIAKWLNISKSKWHKEECVSGKTRLVPPNKEEWAVVIVKKKEQPEKDKE